MQNEAALAPVDQPAPVESEGRLTIETQMRFKVRNSRVESTLCQGG